MTKQEMLAEIEANIREDIPRLVELREGCILQNEWSKDFFKVYDETENHIRIFQENGDFNLYRELKLSKSIERYNFVNWDLSKPLLKDQSEELINFLYDLIKQQKWNN